MGETNAIEEFATAVAIPYLDTGVGEGDGRCVARDEPEELGDYSAKKDSLSCYEWQNGRRGL